jgi:hypothetical protein
MRFIFACCLVFFLMVPGWGLISPEKLVLQLDENFSRLKDGQTEITLDTSLQLLGCGGLNRQTGYLWFKAPDKVKAIVGQDAYFLRGNRIRKIDNHGKRFYVTLLHAPDFTPGFNPKLITYNFRLTTIKETTTEVILEGLPKPGTLKNVKKVLFRIDPVRSLLTGLDLSLNQGLSGRINIKYEQIGGVDVPTACYGKSALEIFSGSLVGLVFNLRGEKPVVNGGLSDKLFDPGF